MNADFYSGSHPPFDLEETQECLLHNNWPLRKDLAKRIGGSDLYDVFDYQDGFGRRIFYIVKNGYPVGYVSGYVDLDGHSVQINSTYLSPIVRRKGLGTMVYKTIIQNVDMLISDSDRSEGANRLWAKLAQDPTLDIQTSMSERFTGTRK